MKDIILFDIDKTIFDRDSFLHDFYKIFLSRDDVEKIYEENKKSFGHFKYVDFLNSLIEKYPDHESQINSFFETENIEKYLFDDSKVLMQIENYRLGIWSKGDPNFQKQKITIFKNIFNVELIYIYEDKIQHIPEMLLKNKNAKTFIVDDNLDALEAVKKVYKKAITIFIDRNGSFREVNENIDFRIQSLFDIIQILKEYEKTT